MTTTPPVLLLGPAQRNALLLSAFGGDGSALTVLDYPPPADFDFSRHRLAIVEAHPEATEFIRRWRTIHGQTWRPVLWLADDTESRVAGWHAGADACLSRPFGIGELSAQIDFLLRQQEACDRLQAWADEAGRLNRSLADLYRQSECDRRLARVVQAGFASTRFPLVGRARFAVSQRARSNAVSDFYLVHRAADQQAAWMLGDVMGQSLSAGLLAMYLQQIVKESDNAFDPPELLLEANRALMRLDLPEPPLVRMTAGLIDCAAHELCYASAGHTAPLLMRKDAAPQFLPATGSMLGLGECKIDKQTARIDTGDRFLVYTDGLTGDNGDGPALLAKAAVEHRHGPLSADLESIAQELVSRVANPDMFTLLALEMG